MKKILAYLYRKNKNFFLELAVKDVAPFEPDLLEFYDEHKKELFGLFLEDMIGQIPSNISEPTADFLAKSGKDMEKWLLWQSWLIQRKATSEPKFSEIYQGMLLQIRVLLTIATKKLPPAGGYARTPDKKEDDPIKGVEAFMEGLKAKPAEVKV